MTSDVSHELLNRQLPPAPLSPDGSTVHPAVVEAYTLASAALIDGLRQRVVDLEQQVAGGADTYNRMVRLANQTAENIILSAHIEAKRIVDESHRASGDGSAVGSTADSDTGPGAEFREEWEREASIDERYADKAFFEQENQEPSRIWILADAG